MFIEKNPKPSAELLGKKTYYQHPEKWMDDNFNPLNQKKIERLKNENKSFIEWILGYFNCCCMERACLSATGLPLPPNTLCFRHFAHVPVNK